MALKTADLVYETTTTAGSGPFTLGGAIVGHRTFASATEAWSIGSSQIAFVIRDQIDPVSGLRGPKFMIASGTLVDATHITVDTVYSSSNNGNPENFGAGAKDIYSSIPASLLNQLPGAGVSGTPYVALTGSRSLTQTDNGLTLSYAGTTPITLTIPTGLSSFECAVVQAGTGVITIAAATGVTAGSASGGLATNGANSAVGVTQTGANAFLIIVPGLSSAPTFSYPTLAAQRRVTNTKGINKKFGSQAYIAGGAGRSGQTSLAFMHKSKEEVEAPFSRVRHLVFTKEVQSSRAWQHMVAVTETAANDTASNQWLPIFGGVAYNSYASTIKGSPRYGWVRGSYGGSPVSPILPPVSVALPSFGYYAIGQVLIGDWLPLKSVPRADGGANIGWNSQGRPLLMSAVRKDAYGNDSLGQQPFTTGGNGLRLTAEEHYQLINGQLDARYFLGSGGNSGDPVNTLTDNVLGLLDPLSNSNAYMNEAFEVDYDAPVRSFWAVGDSMTESRFGTSGPGNSSLWWYSAVTKKSTPAAPWTAFNAGFSTCRTETFTGAFYAMLQSGMTPPTDLLYPLYSVNNVSPSGRFNQNDIAKQKGIVLELLDVCKVLGIKLYLWTVPNFPITGTDTSGWEDKTAIADLYQWAKNICATGAATMVDVQSGFNVSTMLLADNTHFNSLGQRYAESVLTAVLA